MEIILPLPVTLNNLTYNNNSKNGGRGGRTKTKKAKNWYRDAQYYCVPYMRQYQEECNRNIATRQKAWSFEKKTYDLFKLHEQNMTLSYNVEYHYWFECERHKRPCDVFNYEKQLSDFLHDMGFLLDDSFIDDGRVVRAGTDPQNPRVQIFIKKII